MIFGFPAIILPFFADAAPNRKAPTITRERVRNRTSRSAHALPKRSQGLYAYSIILCFFGKSSELVGVRLCESDGLGGKNCSAFGNGIFALQFPCCDECHEVCLNASSFDGPRSTTDLSEDNGGPNCPFCGVIVVWHLGILDEGKEFAEKQPDPSSQRGLRDQFYISSK